MKKISNSNFVNQGGMSFPIKLKMASMGEKCVGCLIAA
jgi:hypothetical protein